MLANTLQSGETIPIRLFLGGFDLTPTFRDVNKKYSTRYYLSLVLIDEGVPVLHCISRRSCYTLVYVGASGHTTNSLADARRYFKQSEIVLFRQAPLNLPLALEQNKQIAVS